MQRVTRRAVMGIALGCAVLVMGCARSSDEGDRQPLGNTTASNRATGDGATGTVPGPADSGEVGPEGWPADIPVPAGFESLGTSEANMDGKLTTILAGTTSWSADEIKVFYTRALPDWTVTGSNGSSGGTGAESLHFEDGTRSLGVGVSDDGEARTVNLSYSADGN